MHTMSIHLQKKIKFSLCDTDFTTRQALHRHKENNAAGEIKYSCEACERPFSRKEPKNVHVFNWTNSQPTEKPSNKDNFFLLQSVQ